MTIATATVCHLCGTLRDSPELMIVVGRTTVGDRLIGRPIAKFICRDAKACLEAMRK